MFSVLRGSHNNVREHRIFTYLGVLWIIAGLGVLAYNWFLPRVEVSWTTKTEINAAGFNVYRSDAVNGSCEEIPPDTYQLLNDELIPSNNDATGGGDYRFVDRSVKIYQTYCYQLEDVEFDQTLTRHDPLLYTAGIAPINIVLVTLLVVCGVYLIISSLRMEKTND